MKTRYVVRGMNWVAPRDEELGRDAPPKGNTTAPTVFEAEGQAIATGVLDPDGHMIMKQTIRSIGFVSFEE